MANSFRRAFGLTSVLISAEDVLFEPLWTMDTRVIKSVMANETALIFERTDWEVIKDIFCWEYKIGIVFCASKYGGMNGQMRDVHLRRAQAPRCILARG